jgi:hypothetical protein
MLPKLLALVLAAQRHSVACAWIEEQLGDGVFGWGVGGMAGNGGGLGAANQLWTPE